MEISSKAPVKRFREVIQAPKKVKIVIKIRIQVKRLTERNPVAYALFYAVERLKVHHCIVLFFALERNNLRGAE